MADGRSDDPVGDEPALDAGVDDDADERRQSGKPAGPDPGTPGPGARLRAAREASGLDQGELAEALNLSRRVVRALEEDDDETLPGATFVRGYIRSWARLTGEPEEPLLAAYEARAGRPRPMVQPTPGVEPVSRGNAVLHHRPGLVMTIATLILAAFGAMILFGIWPDALERSATGTAPGTPVGIENDRTASRRPGPEAGPSTRSPAGGASATSGSASAGADPVDASPDDPDASAEDRPDAAAPDPDFEVPVSAAPVPEDEDAVAADLVKEVSANGSETRVLAGGDAHLHLVFRGDCWVEIRDGDDRVVHRDLHGSGQVLDLLGRAPFRVRLGYAPAVELSYNDSRVPLAPHTRNDVASLVIGR